MFSRLSQLFVFAVLGFAVLAAATPWNTTPKTTPTPTTVKTTTTATTTVTVTGSAPPATTTVPASGPCSTGPVQCCNSVQPNLDVIVGITCSPITVIGVGGDSCTQQTVCCENNNFSGIIAIGCTPINIAL
ncbi:fungal hydrophobin [Auriscalpium vulgare]|uniref:Fungal hydrophobin n=1 Tax=Auriscalpium vulgare TaxID=40419 RepID=A0ACB8RX15_9AGAM|nr:fungal hydrophobin [Auriscalpium vulgare]